MAGDHRLAAVAAAAVHAPPDRVCFLGDFDLRQRIVTAGMSYSLDPGSPEARAVGVFLSRYPTVWPP